MKIFVLCMALMLCAAVALGWQLSVHTTWSGSQHVDGSDAVIATTKTGYITLCSPTASEAGLTCPSQYNWTSRAKLTRPQFEQSCSVQCGGNCYKGPFDVVEDFAYSVGAVIVPATTPSSAGPASATASGTPVYCNIE